MRNSWLWDNAVTLATLVMAVTAIVALIYAHLQVAESRRAQQEANANELWRETLRLGFENRNLERLEYTTENSSSFQPLNTGISW
jgi:hypothetical protein